MKTTIQLITIIFLLALTTACESEKLDPHTAAEQETAVKQIQLQRALQGDETGNGGDNVTVHFKAEAQEVIAILDHYKDKIGVDVDLLKSMFVEGHHRSIVVVSTEQKLYDKFAVINFDSEGAVESVQGEEKEALNFPNGKSPNAYPRISLPKRDLGKPLVILNKQAWTEMIDKKMDMRLLVFHELAPIIGMTDDSGKISHKFKNLMRSWDIERNPGLFLPAERDLDQFISGDHQKVNLSDYPEVINYLNQLNRDLEKSPFDGTTVLGPFQDYFAFYAVEGMDDYHVSPVSDNSAEEKTVAFGKMIEVLDDNNEVSFFRLVTINLGAFHQLSDKQKALQLAVAIMHAQDRFAPHKIEELTDKAREILFGQVLLL